MSSSRETDERVARLLENLAVLAQPMHLSRLGVHGSADELALEFHDSVLLLGQLVDDGLLDEQDAEAVLAVDRKLNEMSGGKNRVLWTAEALGREECWSEVRRLASLALKALEGGGGRAE
jgi:hypothetical protein